MCENKVYKITTITDYEMADVINLKKPIFITEEMMKKLNSIDRLEFKQGFFYVLQKVVNSMDDCMVDEYYDKNKHPSIDAVIEFLTILNEYPKEKLKELFGTDDIIQILQKFKDDINSTLNLLKETRLSRYIDELTNRFSIGDDVIITNKNKVIAYDSEWLKNVCDDVDVLIGWRCGEFPDDYRNVGEVISISPSPDGFSVYAIVKILADDFVKHDEFYIVDVDGLDLL